MVAYCLTNIPAPQERYSSRVAKACRVALFLLTLLAVVPLVGAQDRPNVIFILADDLGYGDLSCYGQKKLNTPNIDRLAAEGLRFTNHYSGSPVCAPSRSTLMTGLHSGHTFIRGNKSVKPEGQWPLPDSAFTLTGMMKDAGYATGVFGKWGLGYPGSEGAPENQGVSRFFGYNCQGLAHNYYPEYLWDNTNKLFLGANTGAAKVDYAPEFIHKEALAFIEKNSAQPFFLFYAMITPHAELIAPEKYMNRYRGKFLPEKEFNGVDAGEPNFRRGPYGSQKESHAAFAAMVDVMDEQVGDIRAKVAELGLEENTIIIFSSDNGPHLEGGADPDYFDSNGILRGYKRDVYEGGIRVPMIAQWKGVIKPGTRTDHPSAFWDVLPTFAELLDVNIPVKTDGVSYLPTLKGDKKGQQRHDYLYWEFHEKGGRRAVRQAEWKLVQLDVGANPPGAFELYNLRKDPGEANNVAARFPERVQAMKDVMLSARIPSKDFPFPADKP